MTNTEKLLEEFVQVVIQELKMWNQIWSDTWLTKTRSGQVARARKYFGGHLDRFANEGQPVPWQKLACSAFEGWIRDNYPELFPDGKNQGSDN